MSSMHLVVLGNAVTARWVLANQRMAFTEIGRRSASRLARGDTLLFYASSACWPGLGAAVRPQSGLVIGSAVVLTDVARLATVMHVGGHRLDYGCEIFFETLAPLGSGVAIRSPQGSSEANRWKDQLRTGAPAHAGVARIGRCIPAWCEARSCRTTV